jgi:hypothetical protein
MSQITEHFKKASYDKKYGAAERKMNRLADKLHRKIKWRKTFGENQIIVELVKTHRTSQIRHWEISGIVDWSGYVFSFYKTKKDLDTTGDAYKKLHQICASPDVDIKLELERKDRKVSGFLGGGSRMYAVITLDEPYKNSPDAGKKITRENGESYVLGEQPKPKASAKGHAQKL